MFPDGDHAPTGTTKPGCLSLVSGLVPGDLLKPPTLIVLRYRVVPRAAVPEAPMDEHCQSTSRQHNVRPTR